VRPLGIEGAWVYTPRIHEDARGSFLEWFSGREVAADVGHELAVAQANCPVTWRGGVRGIHFTDVPPGQAKYVSCVAGEVLDVVVDVRAGSPTFGRWESVRLDDRNRRAVYLAEGLGHAFMALSAEATVMYLCSTPYDPGREHGLDPMDPELGIAWPDGVAPILSAKDAAAPTLREAERMGILPAYADCTARAARARSAPRRPGGGGP
jgi:dTDP-4-dehydrorhamnose 3,5-epimerase